jgi:hypothetical protein
MVGQFPLIALRMFLFQMFARDSTPQRIFKVRALNLIRRASILRSP